MGWPLILALASSAAEAEGQSADENLAREDAFRKQQTDAEMVTREAQAKREAMRRAAMQQALKSGPQPIIDQGVSGLKYDDPSAPVVGNALALSGASKGLDLFSKYLAKNKTNTADLDFNDAFK